MLLPRRAERRAPSRPPGESSKPGAGVSARRNARAIRACAAAAGLSAAATRPRPRTRRDRPGRPSRPAAASSRPAHASAQPIPVLPRRAPRPGAGRRRRAVRAVDSGEPVRRRPAATQPCAGAGAERPGAPRRGFGGGHRRTPDRGPQPPGQRQPRAGECPGPERWRQRPAAGGRPAPGAAEPDVASGRYADRIGCAYRHRDHRHGRRRTGIRAAAPSDWRRRGQEAKRVVVGVAAARVTDTEVEVRRLHRAAPARADGAEALTRGDLLALADRHRGQVQVGSVEAAVGGAHRHGEAGRAGRPGEAHRAGGGRAHGAPTRRRDVDAAVLAARVGVVAVAVGREDLSLDRPAPAGRGTRRRRGHEQRGRDREQQRSEDGTDGHAGKLGREPRLPAARRVSESSPPCGFPSASVANRYRGSQNVSP